MEVYNTTCLIEGHPCLVSFDYGSDNNVVSQRLVEKLQLPITFHPMEFYLMPLTKGPTTRAMARRIQEEWASNEHTRPKMNFTWAKEDVKT